ncbi:MAG: phosphatase [Frankiales bacterium]|nr:phosphatase [Frankiales bacterium]
MAPVLESLLVALHGAAPDRVADAVATVLEAQLGASDVALFLVDYQQNRLVDVAHPAVLIRVDDGSLVGRTYAAQQTQLEVTESEAAVVYLPVASRGDRLGVLRMTLPSLPDQAMGRDLWHVAELLGEALAIVLRLTDTYETLRRTQSLTLAAEMQWQLLPPRTYADARVAIAGQLEPAYSIAGDSFDWSLDRDVLWVAAVDGNGRGLTATLGATVAITALRNARRAGASLADQAGLADQALYSQFGGEQFVSTLLLEFDLGTRMLRAIDAGSPQLMRLRGNKVTHLELEAQLPLGMFEETIYREQSEELATHDRYVVVSDGVHGARSPRGDEFGGSRLERVIQRGRLLSAAEATRQVVRELRTHRVGAHPDDDAVVLWIDLDPDG